MDLRLRSNEVAARFSMKPSGLRSFCLCALSLLGRRSLRIGGSEVASRTKPKILSAAVSIIFQQAARQSCLPTSNPPSGIGLVLLQQ